MISNKEALLALNRIPTVGPRSYLKLHQHWPNLGELFSASLKDLQNAGLTIGVAEAITQFKMEQIQEDLDWECQESHTIITCLDSFYPVLLKEIHDPPMILYAMGKLSSLQHHTIGIVGTRNPSPSGAETAWQFAFELSQQGFTIVSGLALGIDAQAHSGSLAANGRTVASVLKVSAWIVKFSSKPNKNNAHRMYHPWLN